ncbi:MAG: hypothetical protein Q9186_000560 [Xanthomendoza sp. 1 TL-2023]
MSRHKLVKTMNLDDELDDFDGADYDDDYNATEELTADDKARLHSGVQEVRTVLGPSINISDEVIEDSLWHYYYDVSKTVNYFLRKLCQSDRASGLIASEQQAPTQTTKPAKKHQNLTTRTLKDEDLSVWAPLRPHYAPWLNIPSGRRGEILIEPLYPRGGLRGGSPGTGGAKMSKLAALAAARKKKENEKQLESEYQESNASVAILDKLGNGTQDETAADVKNLVSSRPEDISSVAISSAPTRQNRKYPSKRRHLSPEALPAGMTPENQSPLVDARENSAQEATAEPMPKAAPSSFATTMFGSSQDPLLEPFRSLDFALPQPVSSTKAKRDPFAGPSPDDVVTKAQSSSKGAKSVKKESQIAEDENVTDELSASVDGMKIDEGLRFKSKNIDVLAEFQKSKAKNAANFVVIGHVDAGKSTLMGRLLYDLKVVDQRTVDRHRKEAEKIGKSSFALAWVLDQGTEERNRGVTIDIAMNKFETSKTSFTILDAPGHRDFIPNMIAGASQADFAVLVIDAGTGNFESGLKGQTKEHAILVRSMGVQKIVIAVNKLDTIQWSKDRFDEIQQQVRAFLTAAGFLSRNIAFVPCSGLKGDNIVKRADEPKASWYTGPILIEQLEASEPTNRALDKPLRLTIADIFRGGVQNPLSISGRLDSGSLQVGDRIVAMPSKESAVIKGVEVDLEPADWAVAGQNVILHLTDIEQQYLKAGDVICPPSALIQNVTSITVKLLAFDHITPMHVEVHRGRLHVPGRITQLVAVLDKVSGATVGKKKPRLVQPGSVARVVIQMESAVPLEAPGKYHPSKMGFPPTDEEFRKGIRKEIEAIQDYFYYWHYIRRHSKAQKKCDKLNKYGAYSDIYDEAPYKKQSFIEKVLHIKKTMTPQEQREYEDELLEREKLILGDMWNENHDWGWHEMSRLIDIQKQAKDAGVKPLDGSEMIILMRVKKGRGLGMWKDFNKRRGFNDY